MDNTGHYEFLQARKAAVIAHNPHLAHKIRGVPPVYVPAAAPVGFTPAQVSPAARIARLKARINRLKSENGSLRAIVADLHAPPDTAPIDCRTVIAAFCDAMNGAGHLLWDTPWNAAHLASPQRSWALAHPRMVCMWLCREITKKSTTIIGQSFGGRDHTTCMHGCERAQEIMERNPALRAVADEVLRLFEMYVEAPK